MERVNPALALAVFALAGLAGAVVTGRHEAAAAASAAGPDLVRLLRAMAVIKSVLALTAFGAVLWRLDAPAGAGRLAAYLASSAAMAAGPGLIWGMVHVAAGALLLHGGLAGAVVLLWTDPTTANLLAIALRKKDRESGGDGTSPPVLTCY